MCKPNLREDPTQSGLYPHIFPNPANMHFDEVPGERKIGFDSGTISGTSFTMTSTIGSVHFPYEHWVIFSAETNCTITATAKKRIPSAKILVIIKIAEANFCIFSPNLSPRTS